MNCGANENLRVERFAKERKDTLELREEIFAALPRGMQRNYLGFARQTQLMGKNESPVIAAERARRGKPAISAAHNSGSNARNNARSSRRASCAPRQK